MPNQIEIDAYYHLLLMKRNQIMSMIKTTMMITLKIYLVN